MNEFFSNPIVLVVVSVAVGRLFFDLLPFELPGIDVAWQRGTGWTIKPHGFYWKVRS